MIFLLHRGLYLFSFFLFISCSTPATKSKNDLTSIDLKVSEVKIASREAVQATGKKWMISTQGKYASLAAQEIMKKGGTLIDAAIAASFVIGVERPHSTGIGGGGFLIYHEAKTGKNFVLDFRERAPKKAMPSLYLDSQGKVIPEKTVTGPFAVAVPGLVRGLKLAHQKWGRLDWKTLVSPAEKLAHEGFLIYPHLANAIQGNAPELAQFSESKATFLHADGSPKKLNEVLKQENLAKTLKIIARNPEDFYQGSIANKISKAMKSRGGILSSDDLKSYKVKIREALSLNWNGYQVVSMPPPSSGGVHVLQILKMLESDTLENYGMLSKTSVHLTAQAMQQAFADRAEYLGDPDFVPVPVNNLLNSKYLAHLRSKFNLSAARTAQEVSAGQLAGSEHFETTHFTLMDEAGNVVVSTQTINGGFGSKWIAEGTGIVLNNEMDDFSVKVGEKNIFGATATSHLNEIEPFKTPLSSMSPTIVLKNGMPVLALGAPGGTRIITAVAQTILNYFVYHQDLYSAIAAPRIHQQWQPDLLTIENQNVDPQLLNGLQKLGWKIGRVKSQSHVMAVARENDTLIGVADPRDIGTSIGE